MRKATPNAIWKRHRFFWVFFSEIVISVMTEKRQERGKGGRVKRSDLIKDVERGHADFLGAPYSHMKRALKCLCNHGQKLLLE